MKMRRLVCLILAILCLSSSMGVIYAGSDFDKFQFQLAATSEDEKAGYTPTIITTNSDDASAWEKIYTKYKTVINFLYIIMTLTCLAGLIIAVMKLGSSGGNPQMRQQAVMGILFCGIGVALLGSVGLWFGFAMNIL